MKTPLAWLNLLHQKTRTAVAVAGVAFAVVLIMLQLGFLASVRQTATRVYDRLNFDLLLTSPQYLHLSKAGTLPRLRLTQAASAPGVTGVSALDVGFQLWRNAETGQRRGILLFGIDPGDESLRVDEIIADRDRLEKVDTVLIDRLSRSEFGPIGAGTTTEVGSRTVRVVGQFTLGTGFSADGAIVSSDTTFHRLLPFRRPSETSLGLVRLGAGVDPEAAAEALRSLLPPDVQVFTRDEIAAHERRHWVTKTSVGIIFGFGVFVALLVGTAIVYQVLSSDITSHLAEYATLKAMGYSRQYLSRLVLQQALILAVAGFVPGLLIAELLYQITARMTHIPIELTSARCIGVLVLSLVMCGISGLASLAKVHSADPAELF